MSRAFMVAFAITIISFSGCLFNQFHLGALGSSMKQDKEQEQDKKKDPLMNPSAADAKAPDKFKVKFETTAGDFEIQVTREWSPNGADRFYNMVKIGYFKDIAIFRAIDGFMFQFGIHGNPDVNTKWRRARIDDDKSKDGVSNLPGYISFATSGKNSRTTQMFINLGDNARLDGMGFTPFGKVVDGMKSVEKVNTEYGENPRRENVQGKFQTQGNEYIKKRFPNLDYIKKVTIVSENGMKK